MKLTKLKYSNCIICVVMRSKNFILLTLFILTVTMGLVNQLIYLSIM